MSKLVLYDIPTKDPRRCWSLNTWKTRMALNFKGVDYETKWVEYPDIAATLKELGVTANSSGPREYTCPAVRFPDGTAVMESTKIAAALEERYPEPSFNMDSPEQKKLSTFIVQLINPTFADWMTQVPDHFLLPRSKEYFIRTREESLGKTLTQAREEDGGDTAWAKSRPAWEDYATLLKAKGGPFLLGSTASYADFAVVSFLKMIDMMHLELFNKIMAVDPVISRLYEACGPWLERNDH
ncbi:hypothetical protein BT63DRAFT_429035 [Microthyrium microscopicum]|uniref:GST N-terminal domain-containing protein n=1 Tax=Microthyrium microscopicum TaxID=703497 RepID=A0A6A6TZH0_9PEZI|nr:hypothetical protein BT63DRAFT_429035 [Microthyrium microscopicum]